MDATKPLRDRRLIVASDVSVRDLERRWVEPLLAGWPRHVEAPNLSRVGLYELKDHLAAGGMDARPTARARPAATADAVLVIAGPSVTASQVHQFADGLDRSLCPAIIVLDGRSEHDFARLAKRGLTGLGVPVESDRVSPGHLASALVGMMQRQPALDRLAEDMAMSQLTESRLHIEMERVHHELLEAARLQHEFVRCAAPYTPGVEFGVVYRPATSVSGDIFDIEQLDEHRIGIFLADAVGHGVPAGMLTLFITRSLPKVDGHSGTLRVVPPGEALARLNAAYCGRTSHTSRFATAVYAVLDTRTMRARVAIAGHPPPLVTTQAGGVRRLEPGGPLLGVFPDAAFPEAEIDLSRGESLVMYTDGFEVAYPEAGEPGGPIHLTSRKAPLCHVERLATLGRSGGDRDALASAVAALQCELDAQVGSLHQVDDVTAVVVAPAALAAAQRAIGDRETLENAGRIAA